MNPQRGNFSKSNVLIIVLVFCLLYMVLSYWRVSTSNVELAREILRIESIIHLTESKWQRVEKERIVASSKVMKCNSDNLLLQTEVNAKAVKISELTKLSKQLRREVNSLTDSPLKIGKLENQVAEASTKLLEANGRISNISTKLDESNEMNLFLKKEVSKMSSLFEAAKRSSADQLEKVQLELNQCLSKSIQPTAKTSHESSKTSEKVSVSMDRSVKPERDARLSLNEDSLQRPDRINGQPELLMPPPFERRMKLSEAPEIARRSDVEVNSRGMEGIVHHRSPVLVFDAPDSMRPSPRLSVTQL